jgi:hypothetical protein
MIFGTSSTVQYPTAAFPNACHNQRRTPFATTVPLDP